MKHLKKMTKLKKICALALASLLFASACPAEIFATSGGTDWTISKSKTATNLDENFESKVTLSLPSAEEQKVFDVVFVLDKSTSAVIEDKAIDMLNNLKDQVTDTKAAVKVGVVIFNKEANATGLLDLETQYEEIETAIRRNFSSGTNAHAGLVAGKELLDSDTTVAADHKYLIFVSDGITYIFDDVDEEGKHIPTSIMTTAYEANAGAVVTKTSDTMDALAMKYPYSTDFIESAGGMDSYLANIEALIEADQDTYWGAYGSENYAKTLKTNKNGDTEILSWDRFIQETGNEDADFVDNHANNIDTAIYLTVQTYQEAVNSGYHCYAVKANLGTNVTESYPWADTLMEYLSNEETVDFDQIQNEICYLVDAGSKVEDYMGYVDGDYDFDFVNEASALSLKIGDVTYDAEPIGENQYGFKALNDEDYAYTLTYNRGNGKDEEMFTWNINEPVSNFEAVQLTYTVKLVNPKSEAGTYGQYDANGSQGYEGLYTNNAAVLYPVDSEGNAGDAEAFYKPTVSYIVNAAVDPEDPTTPPEEPTTPPEEPISPSKQPTKPTQSSEVVETGDESHVALWGAMMLATLACMGLVAVKRRLDKQ